MKCEKTFRFLSEIGNIEPVLDDVLSILNEHGIERKIAFKIRLVLEEIIVNVVSYAYGEGKGDVELRCAVEDDPKRLSFQIIDSGKPFDPTKVEEPDLDVPIEQRRIGGLGIFIVKSIMDEMVYERQDNQNILTLKKRIG